MKQKKATYDDEFSDRAIRRRQFLQAVAGAQIPIRAGSLSTPGLNRRGLQKRLERLRQEASSETPGRASDAELVAYARRELARSGSPLARGLLKLQDLAYARAREFSRRAGEQATVIGDWIELSHSPGDLGWSRDHVRVEQLATGTVFARGKMQSWLTEKKRFLKAVWPRAAADPTLRGNLVPNQLKMDLVDLVALGTEDSPLCAIRVAPVDWLTCFALNSRLDETPLSLRQAESRSVRETWGDPRRTVERRGLPGMMVGHIVVETADSRFLVCQRQPTGLQDEPGTWSLSIEERWSGRLPLLRGRDGQVIQASREADAHPHDVVRRALREELGITVTDRAVRVLSWGIEASVLYPGFIALARTDLASWEIEGLRPHAADANEIRLVASIPAELDSLRLIDGEDFAPEGRPELRRRWHRTAKARLFVALAHRRAENGLLGREEALAHLGSQRATIE